MYNFKPMRKANSTNFSNEKDLLENCGMYYTLSLLAGRWKVSILAALLANKVMRYTEIKNSIAKVSERMLIKQLKELMQDGLILRRDYTEMPPRVEYQISERGKSLQKVLLELQAWGKKYKTRSVSLNDAAQISS